MAKLLGLSQSHDCRLGMAVQGLASSNNPEILFYAKSEEDVPGRNRSINSKFDNDTASCDWLAGN